MKLFIPKDEKIRIKEMEEKRDRNKKIFKNTNLRKGIISMFSMLSDDIYERK